MSKRGLSRYSGYLFALPYLLLFGGFVVLPLLYGLSFFFRLVKMSFLMKFLVISIPA